MRAVNQKGLSLVEVLVSLLLLGGVIILSLGIVIPLRVTKTSAVETQALSLARSYIELVRTRWSDENFYAGSDAASDDGKATTLVRGRWPKAATASPYDLKLPTGWTLERSAVTQSTVSTANTTKLAGDLIGYTDTLRRVTVKISPPTGTGEPVTISTYITRPQVSQ
jgi:Tfp pilus assembly protein PilV